METKISFVTRDCTTIDSLIIYTLQKGWLYCFVSTVREWLDGATSTSLPMRLREPVASDYRMKVQVNEPKWKQNELFTYIESDTGWDERYIDGLRDEDFPPLDPIDEEECEFPDGRNVISLDEKEIFGNLLKGLLERFNWPSTLCRFCLSGGDKISLRRLPNGLYGLSEDGFELCLWKWCLIPTWARSSFLDENYSKAAEWQ